MTSSGKYCDETVGCDTESKPFVNKFINDGSFLETFKKMQEEQQKLKQSGVQSVEKEEDGSINQHESPPSPITIKQEKESKIESPDDKIINSTVNSVKSSSSSKVILGKRRNQKLKVGIIKRDRKGETESEDDLDAWSKYMKEVRQYKEKYGDDSDKKRPLVK